jgi:hypothetical protein
LIGLQQPILIERGLLLEVQSLPSRIRLWIRRHMRRNVFRGVFSFPFYNIVCKLWTLMKLLMRHDLFWKIIWCPETLKKGSGMEDEGVLTSCPANGNVGSVTDAGECLQKRGNVPQSIFKLNEENPQNVNALGIACTTYNPTYLDKDHLPILSLAAVGLRTIYIQAKESDSLT